MLPTLTWHLFSFCFFCKWDRDREKSSFTTGRNDRWILWNLYTTGRTSNPNIVVYPCDKIKNLGISHFQSDNWIMRVGIFFLVRGYCAVQAEEFSENSQLFGMDTVFLWFFCSDTSQSPWKISWAFHIQFRVTRHGVAKHLSIPNRIAKLFPKSPVRHALPLCAC